MATGTTKPYAFRASGSANTYMLVGDRRMWLNGWTIANAHGVYPADVNVIDPATPLNSLPVLGPVPPGP